MAAPAPGPAAPPAAALSPAAQNIIGTALASLTQMAVSNGVALPAALAGIVAPAPAAAAPPPAAAGPDPADHIAIVKTAKYTADAAAVISKLALERVAAGAAGLGEVQGSKGLCDTIVARVNGLATAVTPANSIGSSDEARAAAAAAVATAEETRTLAAIVSEAAVYGVLFPAGPGAVYAQPAALPAFAGAVPTVAELAARAAYFGFIVREKVTAAGIAAAAATLNLGDALKAAQIARATSAAARAYVAAITATAGPGAAAPADIDAAILTAATNAIGAADAATAETEANAAVAAAVAIPAIQFGGKRSGRRRTQKNRRVPK
jgi:hypothetical protein